LKSKQFISIALAIAVFLVAFLAIRGGQEDTLETVVAARKLPSGHTLTSSDLMLEERAQGNLPEGAVTQIDALLGETLSMPRSKGDLITHEHLGGEHIDMAEDERAVAIEVTDSGGLAGLLKPGDRVGVTAVLDAAEGSYAKEIAEGLRVLYVSPEFLAVDPLAYQQLTDPEDEGGIGIGNSSSGGSVPDRDNQGVVVLAVSVYQNALAYDFQAFGVESETRLVNLVDLIPALDHARGVALSLFITPDQALHFESAGIYVPDLVITPGPSPTPTETEIGLETTPTP